MAKELEISIAAEPIFSYWIVCRHKFTFEFMDRGNNNRNIVFGDREKNCAHTPRSSECS